MKDLTHLSIENISIEFFYERYDSIKKSSHYLNMLKSDIEYLKTKLENTSGEFVDEIEMCLHNLRILTLGQMPDTYEKIFSAIHGQQICLRKSTKI